MKIITKLTVLKQVFLIILAFCCTSIAMAQDEDIQEKKERKARSSFKVWAGVNVNGLNIDNTRDPITSEATLGYNLGISYKRGRFFYYEVGARFNQRAYDFSNTFDSSYTSNFSMSALDIPLTAGLNITSFVDRLVGVRVFVSAIPSFTLSKDEGSWVKSKDQIEDFIFYGQVGVGLDITFFFIELGYNYGFSDIVSHKKSEPNQGYLNLGFRF